MSKIVRVRADDGFYFAADIAKMLRFSTGKAYDIIRQLNAELSANGKETYKGRVSKTYFHLRHDINFDVQTTKDGTTIKAMT